MRIVKILLSHWFKYIEIFIQFRERCVGIFNYTIRQFDCMLHDFLLLLFLLPMILLPLYSSGFTAGKLVILLIDIMLKWL